MGIIVIAIVMLGFYFLILRPQQKQMKEQKDMVSSAEVGDEIRTNAGIYGTITALDGEQMMVEIAEGVEVQMHKGSIAELVEYVEDDEDDVADEITDES